MRRLAQWVFWAGRDSFRTCAYLPWLFGILTLAVTGSGVLGFGVFALGSFTVWIVRNA